MPLFVPAYDNPAMGVGRMGYALNGNNQVTEERQGLEQHITDLRLIRGFAFRRAKEPEAKKGGSDTEQQSD
jgi:hypothetical protein